MKPMAPLMLALLLASLSGAAPLSPAPAQAQVSEIDVHMAESAIMSAGRRAAQAAALRHVPSVGVVRLDTRRMFSAFDSDLPTEQEFRLLAERNHAGVARLQRALAANPVTRAALARSHVSPAQVAGVQISSAGSLRLYVFRY